MELEKKEIIKLLTKWAKIQNNCLNIEYCYEISAIETLAEDMKILKKLRIKQPNPIICMFIGTLITLMDNLYGIQLTIPKDC